MPLEKGSSNGLVSSYKEIQQEIQKKLQEIGILSRNNN
jgi:hypothetical protein